MRDPDVRDPGVRRQVVSNPELATGSKKARCKDMWIKHKSIANMWCIYKYEIDILFVLSAIFLVQVNN